MILVLCEVKQSPFPQAFGIEQSIGRLDGQSSKYGGVGRYAFGKKLKTCHVHDPKNGNGDEFEVDFWDFD